LDLQDFRRKGTRVSVAVKDCRLMTGGRQLPGQGRTYETVSTDQEDFHAGVYPSLPSLHGGTAEGGCPYAKRGVCQPG